LESSAVTAFITPLRPGTSHTILVADSNPVARCLVSDRLREEGYRVLEAHSATEATAILMNLPVHLMLLDASMDAGQGVSSLMRLAAGLRPPPILVVTGTQEELSGARTVHPGSWNAQSGSWGALTGSHSPAAPTLIETPCALPILVAIIRDRLGPTAQR
jgi:CheY-like chemotaxis protein